MATGLLWRKGYKWRTGRMKILMKDQWGREQLTRTRKRFKMTRSEIKVVRFLVTHQGGFWFLMAQVCFYLPSLHNSKGRDDITVRIHSRDRNHASNLNREKLI